jgi:hypothetical protein
VCKRQTEEELIGEAMDRLETTERHGAIGDANQKVRQRKSGAIPEDENEAICGRQGEVV